MFEFLIFLSFFYFFLISVMGYGFFFQKILSRNIINLKDSRIIYTGFYGLFFITVISLFTSIFSPHNFVHNSIIHFFGVMFFLFIQFEDKKEYLKTIFLISFFILSALIISKTHDDFSYYHLPFTKYLTEHKVIFGMGNLSHGFKLISSMFFLNSTFYFPFIEYYSFHFSLIFFLIFFNFFILKEIISEKTHEISKYLYLLCFVFFNLSFNRLSEFGTDKAGQLLMVLLFIKSFQLTCLEKNKDNINNLLLLTPLVGFCVILKTYFLSYLLIGLMIFFLNKKFLDVLKILFSSKYFFIFLISLSIYLFHNFASTGCILSPISFTCLGDNLNWAYGKSHYTNLSNWLEQWAKAGAGPNFRIENPKEYIQNLNWVDRWFEYYFMGKVKDQLLLLIFSFVLIFSLFKNFKINFKKSISEIKILFFYLIILVIFLVWFNNHPQLRYGGYPIIFFVFAIPLILSIYKFDNKINFKKRFKFLIVFIIIIFNLKNVSRIYGEFQRTDYYKFNNFPFFSIPKKEFAFEETDSGLIIYKTNGHCWNLPSPCVQSLGKLGLKSTYKNGYYFISNK